MKTSINQRIKEFRTEIGLNQTQFAVQAGLSLPTISSIESNSAEASSKTIKAIVKSFNANESWLLTGKGDMFMEGGLKQSYTTEVLNSNPWKDEAYNNLKSQLDAMQRRYDALFDAVVSGKLGKLLALKYAGNLKQVA